VIADSGTVYVRTLATHETKIVVLPTHGVPIAFYTDSTAATALADAAGESDSAILRDSSAGAESFVLHRVGTAAMASYRVDASQPNEVVSLRFTPRESRALLAALRGGRDSVDTTSIEQDARTIPGSPTPPYPTAQRTAHVQGFVIAQFIVDTTGHVIPRSIRIVQSTDSTFSAAVVRTVLVSEYTPATIAGQKVIQLVRQPFAFTTGR
jgi:TonB family protein